MLWDEAAGHVTRAFDFWKETDRDIRAYLAINARWVELAYQKMWQDAEAEFSAIFDPDRHDVDGHVDVFHDKVTVSEPCDDGRVKALRSFFDDPVADQVMQQLW